MQDLEFPHGLCAFESYRRFRLIQSTHYAELWFLESKEDAELSFPMVPVPLLDSNYQLALSEEDREVLGAENAPLLCFAIVTAYEDSPPTANLLAPVVVNAGNGRAVQAVRADGVYSHKHPLMPEVTCS